MGGRRKYSLGSVICSSGVFVCISGALIIYHQAAVTGVCRVGRVGISSLLQRVGGVFDGIAIESGSGIWWWHMLCKVGHCSALLILGCDV
jgi:hypothetical protein